MADNQVAILLWDVQFPNLCVSFPAKWAQEGQLLAAVEDVHKIHLRDDTDNGDKKNADVALGIYEMATQGLGSYASAAPVQGSSGFHEVGDQGQQGEGGDEAYSAVHKGSSQDTLMNEKHGLHSTAIADHACGCKGGNHGLSCRHQKRSHVMVCGSYQKMFGFLDHVPDLRNVSPAWNLPFC